MDSPVSPTDGEQEGTAWNGHFDCSGCHPLFVFNQSGMPERRALRHGNVHGADGRREVLDPVIARYARRDIMRFFRAGRHRCAIGPGGNGDACAIPAIHRRLEQAGHCHAIRLPANPVLKEKIADRLTRPAGRPSLTRIKRFHEDFEYQAASRDKPRRVIARIGWHPGERFPGVGSIVTNLPMEPGWEARTGEPGPGGALLQPARHRRTAHRGRQIRFALDTPAVQAVARQRGPAAAARPRPQPGHLASRCVGLPGAMADRSLTSLQLKPIKIGARVVRHARAVTFPLAEVALTGAMIRAILAAIRRLRTPPSCA